MKASSTRPARDRLGFAALAADIARRAERAFARPESLDVATFADTKYVICSSSAEPGRYRIRRVPYMRDPLNAFSHPDVRKVTVQKPSQVGFTEGLNVIVAYFIAHKPSPILVVLPNIDPMGRAWSKDRLAPMIRGMPILRELVHEGRGRDTENTVTHKIFPDGHITVAGANAPAGLAMYAICVLLCDEPDRYPTSAGTEGDPIHIAEARLTTFQDVSKELIGGSPTLTGESRVADSLAESVIHYWVVRCPVCDARWRMTWKTRDQKQYRLLWDHDDEGRHRPETARYLCESCGTLLPADEQFAMLQSGEWWHLADSANAKTLTSGWPYAAPELQPGVRWVEHMGFKLDPFYSPWLRWHTIADKFVKSKSTSEKLQVFVNTVLGETFDPDQGKTVDPSDLKQRREPYDAEVPFEVGILTAYVDVQDDRLELEIDGWGADEESWMILHVRIYGEPADAFVWEQLEHYRTKPYQHTSGNTMRIAALGIDTGGHYAEEVYNYVRPRQRHRVRATKGYSTPGRKLVTKLKPKKKGKATGIQLVMVGTETAKDTIFARYGAEPGQRGYMHFPLATSVGGDDEYFAQLGAAKRVGKYVNGRWTTVWKQTRKRDEGLDLKVGNLVMLRWLGPGVYEHLDLWAKRVQEGKRLAGRRKGRGVRSPGIQG